MEPVSWLLCLLLLLVLVQAFHLVTRKGRTDRLPPGPAPIPIFGNLFQIGNNPHKTFTKLAKIHGPMMTLKLGQTTTVVFSSATLAREILQKHDLTFCNRTIPGALRAHQHHEAGMAWVPVSTTWRIIRKICNLDIFTSKKLDANQNLRHRKVQELFDEVRHSCRLGEAIDIGQAAFKTVLNLLSNTVFSIDLVDSTSDIAVEYRELVECIKKELGKPNLGDYFPVPFGYLDLQGINRGMTIHLGKLLDLFDTLIDKRLQLRESKSYVSTNDFLDTLLDFSEENSAELDRNLIKHLLLDLFTAGTDATSSTLEWTMAELLQNPTALVEAQRELKQVIGEGNLVGESDVARLPYLLAIVKETLRLHPAVPFLLPRIADADVELHNFIVPKGAQVLVNAWAIGRDPSIWEDPDSFLPDRFIGSEMDIRGRDFGLIPFGSGRRICPGLPLAMRMLPLILGGLVRSFDWKLEDGVTPESLDMEDKFGLVLYKAQPLRAIPISI